MRRYFAAAITLSLLLAIAAHAQSAVPSPEEFLGYRVGQRFTPQTSINAYFEELARRTPDVRVTHYGSTYEGRPLVYVTITSEKNQQAIEQIRRNVADLNTPQTTTLSRAKEIAASTPAIVWLAYGIHGNESSSSEAAMLVAYDLLTAADSSDLLDRTVVVIDPLQNPDGRERYIHNFEQRRGRLVDANPVAIEHYEPFPSGRYNHYLIDMNRDWAWASQMETRARIEAYKQWLPQVFVDLHEMGPEGSYFFPPDARPVNANIPLETEKWFEVFGRANGEVFSARGWPFFVAEDFDLFYPGYGDSWPSFHGAIGMTYEMAGGGGGGRAGIAYLRKDGAVLTLADRAEHHRVASMTTVRTAAAHRNDLLMHAYGALAAEIDRHKATYIVPADEPNLLPIAQLMQTHGAAMGQLRANARLRATSVLTGKSEMRDFAAGSLVIPTNQPLGGLVQSLLEKSPKLEENFITEQRARVAADEPTEFYDITAWALPLAMNARVYAVDGKVDAAPFDAVVSTPPIPPARFAYLVDPMQPDFYLFIGRLLRSGVKFSVSEAELGASPRLARGALIIERARNGATLDTLLGNAAAGTSIRLRGVDTAWSEGPALGSTKIAYVQDPKIAVVGGNGVEANSFGMLWHTLDIETEMPHTVIPVRKLASADLNQFRVVVIPELDTDLADELGKDGVAALKSWVQGGGTIVAVGSGAAALRAKDVAISSVKEWNTPKKDEEPKESDRKNDYSVPGAAFATTMSDRSYLTFGVSTPPAVMIGGTSALAPLPRKVDNVVSIAEVDPLVAGFAFTESISRLKRAPYLTREDVGRGSVITFADQPFFRLFWRGTLPLLMNAVVYSPTFNDR